MFGKIVATPVGLEPTTPSLEGWCSNPIELRGRSAGFYHDESVKSDTRILSSDEIAPASAFVRSGSSLAFGAQFYRNLTPPRPAEKIVAGKSA